MKKYPIYLTMRQIETLREIQQLVDHIKNEKFSEVIDFDSLNHRTSRSLLLENIDTYSQLSEYHPDDLLRIDNFGRSSLKILRQHIGEKFPYDWRDFKLMEYYND
tara:strand:- start:339 stop:653 length:315 start_codon:yes stop_codon:yes gene_type:complete